VGHDDPARKTKGELYTMRLQILRIIQTAENWHMIAQATDALFHAELIAKQIIAEAEQRHAGGQCEARPTGPTKEET